MTIPDYQTLMLPLLRQAADKSVRVPEIDGAIADEFGLNQSERDPMLPSGRQKLLHNRLHWAKFYMSKAGLVESSEGRFIASAAGRQLLSKNPAKIDNELLLEYPSFQDFYRGGSSNNADSIQKTANAASAPALVRKLRLKNK